MQHYHADLICRWARNKTLTVWMWNFGSKRWEKAIQPILWSENDRFAVGERPTEPPNTDLFSHPNAPDRTLCYVEGITYPKSLDVQPENGDKYYVVDGNVKERKWRGSTLDIAYMYARVCHSTYEAADAHNAALTRININASRGNI